MLFLKIYYVTVSYTHLDVYKRQSEDREMRTVWLYSRSARQSLSELSAQMTDLLEEAERRGYIVVGTSQDRHSGKSIHRVGLKLMVGEVRRGNAHIGMVWDLSRLSRDNSKMCIRDSPYIAG